MINIELLSGVANAHQRFQQRINGWLMSFEVDYVSYTKTPYWVMNVYRDGVSVANGLPLNVGADLLANHNVGDFGRLVFVGEPATLDNLGTANSLVWIPSE